jgi:hypothetical protein
LDEPALKEDKTSGQKSSSFRHTMPTRLMVM